MNRSYFLLIAIIISSIISLLASSCERCKSNCGNSALIEVCKDLKVDTAKLWSLTVDTSADLKKAAETVGVKAQWSYLSADRLGSVKGPFIAHVWGDHFVVVRSDGAWGVSVFDPSIASTDASKPQPISSITDLKTSFSGEVLFVSKGGELPADIKPAGPAAVFEPYVGLHLLKKISSIYNACPCESQVACN